MTVYRVSFSIAQLFKQLIAHRGHHHHSLDEYGQDRFKRFTRRARTVLSLAQEEAQRARQRSIATGHLLLGLLREGDGVAALVLASFDVDLQRARQVVEERSGHGEKPIIGEIGLTPDAKHVIGLAVAEAQQLNHAYLGTEHLLLGTLNEPEGIAILERLGLNPQEVRARILSKIAP
ncbi:Clp protease N-terminal domain-containing protein [Dictyobacter formicarum]|uniref:Clp R domain-containing protein n=1 Tax=Dictyobacter formicarum TaxID=2778368 RepID=A0ABQ3VI77_9CHLR|nr:Clp protease N-terminal domain-containing protein [Dictyobacter formicarum]GHO85887.1 hypothetical protein KSZ_38930 [Dictyobacter formicarum]